MKRVETTLTGSSHSFVGSMNSVFPFPELSRRDAALAREFAVEVELVAESDRVGHRLERHPRGFKQIACAPDAFLSQQRVERSAEVVFDDMGTIHIEDGIPYGQGTEIGAFIRLDDLDPGTPYRDMDRSVFMAPENPNSRMVTPAASYDVITTNHKIDLFAYANNYTNEFGLKKLTVEEVKDTCVMGKRMALGTTQEVGISTTYFANPFGPVQRQEQTEILLHDYFNRMFKQGIKVGQLRTRLGIKGYEHRGPQEAATEILKYITGETELKQLEEE